MINDFDPYAELIALKNSTHQIARAVNSGAKNTEQITQQLVEQAQAIDDIVFHIQRQRTEIDLLGQRITDLERNEISPLANPSRRAPR